MKTIEDKIGAGAIFNEDRTHRFCLWRIWDMDKPKVMFIGLNPSTAAETRNDNTITKVIKIAKNLGYGGIYMMNCFSYISTNPERLVSSLDNSENDEWLITVGGMCKDVIFAWGNFKQVVDRSKEIENIFPDSLALHINKNGSPKHPLYCKDNIIPVNYSTLEYNQSIKTVK